MDEITDLSLKILGRSIKSIRLFKKRNFDKISFMVAFTLDKSTKSMLSITSCQEAMITPKN